MYEHDDLVHESFPKPGEQMAITIQQDGKGSNNFLPFPEYGIKPGIVKVPYPANDNKR